MEDIEDEDVRISNASGSYDNYMESYLNDTFGAPETKQSNPSGIESYLNDRFGSPEGPIKQEKTIPEIFADLKRRR